MLNIISLNSGEKIKNKNISCSTLLAYFCEPIEYPVGRHFVVDLLLLDNLEAEALPVPVPDDGPPGGAVARRALHADDARLAGLAEP